MTRRTKLGARALLFLYGGVTHLLFLRIFVLLNYGPESRSFVDHPLTSVGIPIFGGIFVSWFILPMVRRSSELNRLAVVVRTAGRAVGATALTLEAFYVSTSIFLAFRDSIREGVNPIEGFIGSFIDIQTYGIEALLDSIPFAVGYGVAAGLFFSWVHHDTHEGVVAQ